MDTTENSDSNDITHILIWLLGYKTCDIFRKNFLGSPMYNWGP